MAGGVLGRYLLWVGIGLFGAGVAVGQSSTTQATLPSGPAKPSFQASGMQDNTAPSGYSTGASEAEAKKVATLASELQANEVYRLLPAASSDGCAREPELRRAVQASPESFAANAALGRFYLEHGSAAEAGRYLRAALGQRPADRATLGYAALAELEAKNYAGASELVHRLMGESGAGAGRHANTQSGAEAGGAGAVTDADAHKLLGALDAALGNPSEAIAEFALAARMEPSAVNLDAAALAELAFGSLARAEAAFVAATAEHSESAELWLGRGMAALLAGHKADAGAPLEKAAASEETRKLAYTLLAMEGAGDDAANARVLRELKQLTGNEPGSEPGEALYHYDYAMMLGKMDAGNVPLERAELERAVEAQPEFAAAHYALGVLAARSGDTAASVAELTKATMLDGEIAEWHYRLSQALRRQGQTAAADRELQRFAALKAARGAGTGSVSGAEPLLEGIAARSWMPAPASCGR